MTQELRALLKQVEEHLESDVVDLEMPIKLAKYMRVIDLLEAVRIALAENGELEGNAP